MADDGRERAWAVFDQLADVPADQREAVLRAACGDDLALRAEVERLLAVDDRLAPAEGQAGFLQSPILRTPGPTEPASGAALPAAGKLRLPDHIGRYRVVRVLGEGGMATVYEAEQDEPRRTVALKVMRPGLDSADLRKRFAQEARILGRLHHTGIARVCDAVEHAHKQGVIHRDLKPANILVEDTGQPKVLDFGVAHATGGGLLDTTAHTRTGQILGTLSYMSPEQVAGDPQAIDARSDVYALGVMLYELLAERLPLALDHLPLPEVIRVVQEVEPSRLGSVNASYRGDVETIVGKALAKDKARRYATAGELAADIRRYLGNEPIHARPPSALYQLRKFARRHKALVGGVVATVLALVLGLVGTILFAIREARQRGQAEQNAQVANAE